ncbi:hypothetical protein HU200_066249 [Digitaria exilis]|uniref:Uncharacterized protein n=1 Tax=Digitaria exilis TaxID=1010633 RepID=A0A835DT24_9POAL|nr:hypothetical protein HU200_066249 [Digitaria exilis]
MGLMMQYPVFMPPKHFQPRQWALPVILTTFSLLLGHHRLPLRLLAAIAIAAATLPPPARHCLHLQRDPYRPSPPLDGSTQRTRLLGFTSARDAELRRSGEAMAAATARAPAADKRYQSLRLLPRVPIPLPCFLVGVCGRCCCGRADEDARRWGCGDGGPESHQSVHPKVVFRPK